MLVFMAWTETKNPHHVFIVLPDRPGARQKAMRYAQHAGCTKVWNRGRKFRGGLR